MTASIPSWEVLFASGLYAAEAAKLRGVTYSAAHKWADKHGLKWPHARNGSKVACPCTVRGVKYPSIAAAEAALGLTTGVISYHLNRHGHADFAGLHGKWQRGKPSGKGKEITVCGHTYSTLTAAAADLEISRCTLRLWLRGKLPHGDEKIIAAAMRRDARQHRRAA